MVSSQANRFATQATRTPPRARRVTRSSPDIVVYAANDTWGWSKDTGGYWCGGTFSGACYDAWIAVIGSYCAGTSNAVCGN